MVVRHDYEVGLFIVQMLQMYHGGGWYNGDEEERNIDKRKQTVMGKEFLETAKWIDKRVLLNTFD